tara:strand:+ start:308 stop:565 length:258 start_codon:yes stop_codon:yes gene_type:complete
MEQSTDLPTIKILALENTSDGKLNVEFEVCDEFIDYAKFELGVDSLSQEELGRYVNELISKAIEKKDGYELVKNFNENNKTNIDN